MCKDDLQVQGRRPERLRRYLVQVRCNVPPEYRVIVMWAPSQSRARGLALLWSGGHMSGPGFNITGIIGVRLMHKN